MGNIITIKQRDTARKISDTITVSGVPLNLAGATVVLVMKNAVGEAVTRRNATVVSAAAGTVEYQLVAGDTENVASFQIEWEVTVSGGGILTVPDSGYHWMDVIPDLG